MADTALIIDDEADIRELIALSLDRIGLNTHTAANLEEARNLLDAYEFDVCLTDMRLPDGNGIDFLKYIGSVQPHLPVAVITAHGNMHAAVEAMKNGAFDFVSKPVDLGLLRRLVQQAVSMNRTPDRPSDTSTNTTAGKGTGTGTGTGTGSADTCTGTPAASPRSDAPGTPQAKPHESSAAAYALHGQDRLIGESAPMLELRRMIWKVARTNAPVWITGESGTGKELIARLIHDNGPRMKAPFVAINCGAIPSELMESELFGHRKGSFTGAHTHHDGLFKRAEGGTLFLDEVAELPLHMQVKLLRAIQERSIRPVGSADEIQTDVRILSASHKDLAIEVELGSFRHDLYYRLNVICIRSPPLRDRSEDIVPIANGIIGRIARLTSGTPASTLSEEARLHLAAYTFPGNVRELENILERALALTDGNTITLEDLNLDLNLTSPGIAVRQGHTAMDDETARILSVLQKNNWNRRAAAVQLGMTYRQLRYRIEQYGIGSTHGGS